MSPLGIPRFDVNNAMSISRRVTIAPDRTVTVAPASEAFRGRVYLSNVKRTHPPRDRSMRSSLYEAHDILWYRPVEPIGEVGPGDRVTAGGVVYEALTGVRPKRAGTRTLINEVWVAEVSSLYPILLDLQELGGTVVQAAIPAFVWEEAVTDTTRGEYRRLTAELPVEHFDALNVTNRQLALGGKVHHIDQVTLHLGQPHVTATLREPH